MATAVQRYEVGATVYVKYLNMNTSGKIRSYDSGSKGYYVWIPMIKQEIYYTARELDAWN